MKVIWNFLYHLDIRATGKTCLPFDNYTSPVFKMTKVTFVPCGHSGRHFCLCPVTFICKFFFFDLLTLSNLLCHNKLIQFAKTSLFLYFFGNPKYVLFIYLKVSYTFFKVPNNFFPIYTCYVIIIGFIICSLCLRWMHKNSCSNEFLINYSLFVVYIFPSNSLISFPGFFNFFIRLYCCHCT